MGPSASRLLFLARAAVVVANRLEHEDHLCALAHGELGNALRISGDAHGAEQHLAIAASLAPRDPALLSFRASLLNDYGRFAEASALLQVLPSDLTRNDRARLLIQRAQATGFGGDAVKASRIATRAVRRVEGDQDLLASALLTLAWWLVERGMTTVVLNILPSAEAWLMHHRPMAELHTLWLQGRIALSLGAVSAAEEKFAVVVEGLASSGRMREALMASVDQASALVTLRRSDQALSILNGARHALSAIGSDVDRAVATLIAAIAARDASAPILASDLVRLLLARPRLAA